jgi:hypothetical protein
MRFLHPFAPRTQAPPDLRPRKCPRAFAAALLLLLLASLQPALAQVVNRFDSPGASDSSPTRTGRKRVVKLRQDARTAEAPRFTLAADAPVDDYRSFADGDRFSVLIPRSALASPQSIPSGPGFSDMRVEQRGDDVILSFRLREGASVSVQQNFNRLEVAFSTNERPGKTAPEKASRQLPAKSSSPD